MHYITPDLCDAYPELVQVVKQVRFEKITPGHLVKLDLRSKFAMDGGIPIGGVCDLPVAAGELGQKR